MSGASDTPILEARDVSIRFGGVEALKGVSLRLMPGEVLALAGDNGAGKSTLIKILSGVYRADAGDLHFDGRPLQLRDPQDARSQGIETIYQDLALADNLDVGSNIFLGREPVRRLFGLQVIDRPHMARVAREVLERLDIVIPPRKLAGPVKMLSGGQRQAIAIGRAIYWNARVLIMDEPTAALGVPEQRKVMELIRGLKAQGVAVILISHNLHDIFSVAERIVVLRRGEVAGERRVAETDGDEIVRLMVGDTYSNGAH
ncbi:ATP-binding cassette domain-containing protein [Paraburkholderia silvatlantica]|uniref:Monosaccharide ABC transporter ATP-binding protein (CUT2 family) n=1 Tax=Paraburkholderia silvatlantica TaxID=321895 RepID=A0A2V4TZN4_9BURK|nr:ATP-binding cassette domain-containing protein [Paraburkholderia silvatlantica]PYE12246.1 monosaccharide ABC transporter ATP-binding protein (CUT2 family) [Paraburkholderia silvatlantica]TDQ72084.1 monosaccharide ABC transporter ATP-binding protein (CUT2 family) [Paraburkholderia silvatlantica]